MNVKKNSANDPNKYSELFIIILLRRSSRQKHKDIREAQEQYELYRTLNPVYSESMIPLNEAKLKVDSSDIIYSSQYNIFRSW